MQNRDYAKEYTERALEYMKAVARMEKRFQSRSRYLQRLQVMAEGDSPSPLKKMVRKGTVPFRTKNQSAS